jgi:2-hydroxychromene-2-carboxylate isomerase
MLFSVEISIEKERKKEGKKYFKTNALVPKKAVLRKEEGATVAASPTFSTEIFNFTGNPHKILKMSQTRYETPAIFRLSKLIGSPIQMKQQMKLIRCR